MMTRRVYAWLIQDCATSCMQRCKPHGYCAFEWHDACGIFSVPDLAEHVLRAGHPGWSIWGMDSEAFLQDWKERPERVHIVAPMPTTTHALSSNMLYQPQPQGEPDSSLLMIKLISQPYGTLTLQSLQETGHVCHMGICTLCQPHPRLSLALPWTTLQSCLS